MNDFEEVHALTTRAIAEFRTDAETLAAGRR